jgi:hypothetical protein
LCCSVSISSDHARRIGAIFEIGAWTFPRRPIALLTREKSGSASRPFDPGTRWWDNPTMVVTLDAKRRLTVPAALAPAKPGDYFDARFDAEEDAIIFRRLGGRENWLTVMKACPVSPDDVPARRRSPARRRKL